MLCPVFPDGWQPCDSTAVEAFRFLPEDGVLQLRFVEGRMAYDYPCDAGMFERFLRAPSKGRFVNEVLTPHARRSGWSPRPVRWS
jgi:KTSC domain